jgi:hypothetical protein
MEPPAPVTITTLRCVHLANSLAGRHDRAAEQVFHLDLADGLHRDLAVHQLQQRRQRAHAHGIAVQLVHDSLAPLRRQRRHCQHDFVDAQMLQLLLHARRMEDGQVGDGVVVERAVVVEEAHGLVVDAGAHRACELEASLAGAEDAHPPDRLRTGAAPAFRTAQRGTDQEARDHHVGEGNEPVDQQAGARQPAVVRHERHAVGQCD